MPVGGVCVPRGERSDMPSGGSTRLVGPDPRASIFCGDPLGVRRGWFGFVTVRAWFGLVGVRACEIGGAEVFLGRFDGTGFAEASHAPYDASA